MPLATLDWNLVHQHYLERETAHRRLLRLHQGKLIDPFVDLAIGISDPNGNYSAAEHGIGPKILGTNANARQRVYDLSSRFLAVTHGRQVPPLIKSAGISYLQIGVGSEISCMMNPKVCWIANSRTIWAHLLIKHKNNYGKADDELALYRDNDATSEMAYQIWVAIHKTMEPDMVRLAALGDQEAGARGIQPGSLKYLWADAVANALYAEHFS
jgi:hypothetical protein